jgi:hypothetical protein
MGPRAEYTSIALDPVGAFTRRNLPVPTTFNSGQPAITRVAVLEPGGSVVNVYLASSSGPAAGNMATAGSDVYEAYVAILAFVVPPGTTCNVYAATSHTVNPGAIAITLSAASNVAVPAAVATATAGLLNFFATLPIGGARTMTGGTGYVFEAAAKAAMWGPGVVDIVVPGLDDDTPLALGATDVAVLGTYSITATVVSQGN